MFVCAASRRSRPFLFREVLRMHPAAAPTRLGRGGTLGSVASLGFMRLMGALYVYIYIWRIYGCMYVRTYVCMYVMYMYITGVYVYIYIYI